MLLPTSTSSAKFGSTGDLALHKTSTDTLNALGGSRVETSEVTELRHALELNLSQARNNTDEVSDKSELIGIIDEYLSSFGLPNREKVCEILAQRLSTFWKEHHDPLALRACIKVKTEMLTLYPAGHPKRDGLCGGLAVLLKAVHKQTRDRALLDRAIELEREALHLRPLGHPSRAVTGANLAVSLKTCYDQTGDRILLDQAIELERQVLDLRPSGHPKRDISCCNLAITLKKIYDQVKDDSTLDQAIELQREALDLHPRGHPKRSMSCGNLADFLKARHEKTGESVLLDQVIELEQEALALRPAGHPGRGISCSNLAISLKTRYKHTGNSSLLDQAVELEREALDLYSTDDPIRSILCGQLADSLSTRYKQTGDLALLDEAITLGRESLDLHPAGRPKRGMLCSNLAVLLITRYEQTGDSSLFDQAIALEREVVELHPPGNPGRAIACSNHAITLRTRYKQTGNSMLLDQAVKLHKEALDLCPVGHPDRAMSCHNLASTLMTDFDQKEDRILLDQAIELETEALLLTTEEHPARWQFLCAMAQLTELLPPPLDQETIIGHLYQVFNASAYDDISLVLSSAGGTLLKIDASVLSLQQRPTLMKLYTRALDIVSLAAGLALDISTQLRHISNGNALSLAAFRLSVQLDDISRGLSLLERTRGVIWSQILHMRNPELDQVPEDLSERLQGLLRSAPGSGPGSQAKEVQRLLVSRERDMDYGKRSSIQDVIRQIRSLPELGEFMRGPDAEILLSMGNHNPIVVLIADEKESHALLIMSDHVLSHMLMPDVTQHMLKDLTFESLTSQKRGSEPLGLDSTDRGLNIAKGSSPPHSRLARLWRLIVKPIIKRIGLEKAQGRDRPRIHWCPTGPFTFVPVHAAGIYEGSNKECCADYVVSSYTPTLTALIQARKNMSTFHPHQIKLMAVAAESAQNANMPRLRYAVPEAHSVLDIATKAGVSSTLDAKAATKAEVLRQLQSSHVVHLACHGIQHKEEPHKSHFCLSTGDLEVSELMKIELKDAFLAYLSACETAKGDREHVDETVHLAATMLFAGFRSVVATMWAMNDADGPFVARLFYESLFDGSVIDVNSIPYALDNAVTALRKKGMPPGQWATFVHMGA